eukprot:XP_028343511.1 uncharacterized protein LOC114485917 [Physeter catodon]
MPAGRESCVVPTGGLRVPEGMEAHANWRDLPVRPEHTEEPDCGPLCALVTKYRTKVGDLKKDLTRLVPTVKNYIYTAEDGNQDKAAECEAHMQSALSLVEGRAEMAKERFLEELEKAEEDERKLTNALSEERREKVRSEMERSVYSVDEAVHGCIRLCKRCMDNTYPSAKDRYGDFNLKLGGFTRKLFGEQRKLLDLIKMIKKEKGIEATISNGVTSETTNEADP